MPATNQQKHEAGLHIVVAEALLRGYDAQTKRVGRSSLVEVNGHLAEVHLKTKGAWQIDTSTSSSSTLLNGSSSSI